MTLQEQITMDLANAIKERDNNKRDFLKVIVAELSREKSKTVDNVDVMKLLRKMKENALDMKNELEVTILDNYLPQMMSKENISVLLNSIIIDGNFTSMKDVGAIMKLIALQPDAGLIDKKYMGELIRSRFA